MLTRRHFLAPAPRRCSPRRRSSARRPSGAPIRSASASLPATLARWLRDLDPARARSARTARRDGDGRHARRVGGRERRGVRHDRRARARRWPGPNSPIRSMSKSRGLQPDRPYFYRFDRRRRAQRRRPRAHASRWPARRPASCASGWPAARITKSGYYTAYRHLAAEDLAFVFHYGDYIYEYGPDSPAPSAQHSSDLISCRSTIIAAATPSTKSDPDLQSAHAAHPFFMTFDDHEVRNNWAGDFDDDDQAPPEVFRLRRQSAFQAWYEHMPVSRAAIAQRRGAPALPQRALRRPRPPSTSSIPASSAPTSRAATAIGSPAPEVTSPKAHMISAEEEAWLARNLRRRDAAGTSSPSR